VPRGPPILFGDAQHRGTPPSPDIFVEYLRIAARGKSPRRENANHGNRLSLAGDGTGDQLVEASPPFQNDRGGRHAASRAFQNDRGGRQVAFPVVPERPRRPAGGLPGVSERPKGRPEATGAVLRLPGTWLAASAQSRASGEAGRRPVPRSDAPDEPLGASAPLREAKFPSLSSRKGAKAQRRGPRRPIGTSGVASIRTRTGRPAARAARRSSRSARVSLHGTPRPAWLGGTPPGRSSRGT